MMSRIVLTTSAVSAYNQLLVCSVNTGN